MRGHPWHPSLDPPVFMIAEIVNLLAGRDTFLPPMDGLVFITKEPQVLREINTRTTIEAINLTTLIILISNIWFILPIPKPHW